MTKGARERVGESDEAWARSEESGGEEEARCAEETSPLIGQFPRPWPGLDGERGNLTSYYMLLLLRLI